MRIVDGCGGGVVPGVLRSDAIAMSLVTLRATSMSVD